DHSASRWAWSSPRCYAHGEHRARSSGGVEEQAAKSVVSRIEVTHLLKIAKGGAASQLWLQKGWASIPITDGFYAGGTETCKYGDHICVHTRIRRFRAPDQRQLRYAVVADIRVRSLRQHHEERVD